MLKVILVISSLVFCAGALFASPPSPQDAAEWRRLVTRGMSSLWRSAASATLSAIPSSGDVARYLGRVLGVDSFANAEPGEPSPAHEAQQDGQQQEPSRVWISNEDIECPPGAALPRPWCDPRVQAVLQLLEEDRVRRGDPAPLFCSGAPATLPASEVSSSVSR